MDENDWEIDPLELTLDDFEVLMACEQGIGTGVSIAVVKEVLGRLVVNRTAEEIGKSTIRELHEQLEKIKQVMQELAVPKASDAPS